MRVNTNVFGNSFIPVPIQAVGKDDGHFNEVNTTGFVDFVAMNDMAVMNYSSFDIIDDDQGPMRVPDVSTNMTLEAFKSRDRVMFENPFKMSDTALREFNNYDKPLSKTVTSVIDEFGEESGDKTYGKALFVQNAVVRSLFNPFLTLNVKGIVDNLPLTNSKYKEDDEIDAETDLEDQDGVEYEEGYEQDIHVSRWENESLYDTSDCSIKTLVELSNMKDAGNKYSKLGRAVYKYADFMYCRDLGKVSNNYLVTLRRFAHPVGDNIFTVIGNEYLGEGVETYDELNTGPDVGRMVAWLGDENKLEDILKFSFKDSWKQMESGFYDQQHSQEDDAARGPLGSIINLANPNYRAAVAKGIAGSGNTFLQRIAANSVVGKFSALSANGTYENNPAMLGEMYDKNKIYEPKGTIRDTHLYEGKMTFSHDFTLTFNYELRAYDNINPKAAFLDLIGNVLKVTYRTGSWWKGENRLYGAPGNKAGWQKAMSLIDDGIDHVKDFSNEFLNGNLDLGSFFGMLGNRLKVFAQTSIQGIINTLNGEGGNGNPGVSKGDMAKGANAAIDVLGGMFRNAMGRPAVYAMSSLLSGDPVGLWHVTIGNPRNPILAMGNLIIDNTSIQQYGPLGIDDFPTGLKVVVSLKHAKSRDASEIANMYTRGLGMIHIKPKVGDPMKFFEGISSEDRLRLFGTDNQSMLALALSN